MNMPITKEQIELNRDFVSKELDRCYNIARKSNLVGICLIRWNPLSDRLESKVAYFEENFDAICWKEDIEKAYSKLNIPYEIYSF